MNSQPAALLVTLLLLLPQPARADRAYEPLHGAVSLARWDAGPRVVRLVRELVRIEMDGDRCRVHGTYLLSTGKDGASVIAGFPASGQELAGLQVRVDGKPITPESRAPLIPSPDRPPWVVWPMKFEDHESHTVEAAYETSAVDSFINLGLSPESSPWYQGAEAEGVQNTLLKRTVTVRLLPALTWNQSLVRCWVQVSLGAPARGHVLLHSPTAATISANGITWDHHSFRPAQNWTVTYLPVISESELVPYLGSLQAKHPSDPALAWSVGQQLLNLGAPIARLTALRRFLLAWKDPLTLWGPAAVGPALDRSRLAWKIAATVLLTYHERRMRARARSLAPVVFHLAEEAWSELKGAGPPSPQAVREIKYVLALCRSSMR